MKFVPLILTSLFTFVTLVYLHGTHKISFASSTIKEDVSKDGLKMIHYLSSACGCSILLKDYLIKRGPYAPEEIVNIIDNVNTPLTKKISAELSKAGYKVQVVTEQIPGTPLFEIRNKNHEVAYRGGYTEGTITPFSVFMDLKIFNNLVQQNKTSGYAAIGCPQDKKFFLNAFGVRL